MSTRAKGLCHRPPVQPQYSWREHDRWKGDRGTWGPGRWWYLLEARRQETNTRGHGSPPLLRLLHSPRPQSTQHKIPSRDTWRGYLTTWRPPSSQPIRRSWFSSQDPISTSKRLWGISNNPFNFWLAPFLDHSNLPSLFSQQANPNWTSSNDLSWPRT